MIKAPCVATRDSLLLRLFMACLDGRESCEKCSFAGNAPLIAAAAASHSRCHGILTRMC